MIKLYKCDCEYAVFPFGNGCPVCIRKMLQTKDRKDLMQCTQNGCKHYRKMNHETEERKDGE